MFCLNFLINSQNEVKRPIEIYKVIFSSMKEKLINIRVIIVKRMTLIYIKIYS